MLPVPQARVPGMQAQGPVLRALNMQVLPVPDMQAQGLPLQEPNTRVQGPVLPVPNMQAQGPVLQVLNMQVPRALQAQARGLQVLRNPAAAKQAPNPCYIRCLRKALRRTFRSFSFP